LRGAGDQARVGQLFVGSLFGGQPTAPYPSASRGKIPHHEDFLYPGFRISDSRIPNSVWRMGVPEYRTMYSRLRGSRARAGAGGCNGVGHGVSYLGVLCK
jgi:hypothetical protein